MRIQRTWVCITGVSTPYRLHFWRRLAEALKERDRALEVWLLGQRELGREWDTGDLSGGFTGRRCAGRTVVGKGLSLHLTWGVTEALLGADPELVLASGAWWLPGVLAASGLRDLREWRCLFWSESNDTSMTHRSGIGGLLRRAAYSRFDGFVVPGKRALEYVEKHGGRSGAPAFLLPNIVEEGLYRDRVDGLKEKRRELRAKYFGSNTEQIPILLTCARLERVKGLDVLIDAVSGLHQGVIVAVVGSGSLHSELVERATARGVGDSVRFLGNQQTENVVELLSVADAFVLPSRSDPSPLAVVEAAWAGLPLLLSENVGCSNEYLVDGVTGLSFRSDDARAVRKVLATYLAMSKGAQREMGREARRRCKAVADSEGAVKTFVDEVLLWLREGRGREGPGRERRSVRLESGESGYANAEVREGEA